MITFSNQIVRECKGPTLSVLILLILNPGGVSIGFLQRQSGYTDKSVLSALIYLQETCRAIHTNAGWQLATAVQVPLPLAAQEELPQGDNLEANGQIRNNSVPIIITKDSLINELTLNNNKIRNNSVSDKSNPDLAAIWAELAQMGVKRNARTEKLANLPHVTPDYVLAKRLEFVRDNHGGSAWTGLFIKALENEEPAEALNKRKHLVSCNCKPCCDDRMREQWKIDGDEEAEE